MTRVALAVYRNLVTQVRGGAHRKRAALRPFFCLFFSLCFWFELQVLQSARPEGIGLPSYDVVVGFMYSRLMPEIKRSAAPITMNSQPACIAMAFVKGSGSRSYDTEHHRDSREPTLFGILH